MDIGDPTAAQQALEDLHVSLDHLIKLVEDRALESLDDTGLVGFLQGFEQLRNRLPLIDHQMITEGTTRNLAQNLCQGTMTRVLTSALHISAGEAAGRVRAAETLAERMSMTGQPLEPLRPHLAAKQRSGEASAENADIVVRALAPVTRRGFDPDLIDAGEQLLAQFATQFAPRDLRRLAKQVVDRIDQDGTLPKEEIQQDRRFFRMRPTKDGGYAGEFRLTSDCGAKLLSLLHPLAKPRVNSTTTESGKLVEEPDPRHYGQRMHDALNDMCDRLLRSNNAVPDSGGTPATVIVTIDLEDLLAKTGYALASDGTLIKTEHRPRRRGSGRHLLGDHPLHRPDPPPGPDPADRHPAANHRPLRPRQGVLLPRLRHSPGMVRTTPHPVLGRGRPDRPDQSHFAVRLPPPQLPQQGLGVSNQ